MDGETIYIYATKLVSFPFLKLDINKNSFVAGKQTNKLTKAILLNLPEIDQISWTLIKPKGID